MRRPEKRLPRIERDEVVAVGEDENQHLWAVSYSDFLMVLLSFFILFFSAEAPQKQKLILELASHFTSPPAGAGSGSGQSTGNDSDNSESKRRMPSGVFARLKGLNVTVDKEKESLIINFPNDLYGPGKHRIEHDKAAMIENFLNVMKPYQGQVNLYFEGHADTTPLKIHRNEIVVDNFVLSSLRASSALGLARGMGFSEKNMFIQANSSNLRNSRSLSIRIEPRGEFL